MTFNKWFPGRVQRPWAPTAAERRATAFRLAWWASTLMLVVGYVLAYVFWT